MLFKLWCKVLTEHDDTDACIVNADSENEARDIAAKCFNGLTCWGSPYMVHCEAIGYAIPTITKGMILASHHA